MDGLLSVWGDLGLFDGASPWGIGAIALVVLAAFTVKGAIGIGSLTPTVLFTALILEPHHAVLLALMINVVSQGQFLATGLRHGDWSVVRQVCVANALGAAIGIWIFGRTEPEMLGVLLGLVLGGIVILDTTGLVERIGSRLNLRNPAVVWSLSGLAGLISGVTGAGGLLFLALYLRMVCRDRTVLRGTIMLLSTVAVLWRVFVLAVTGFIDRTLVIEGALLVPIVLLGGYCGALLFRRMGDEWFAIGLRVVILVGAFGLIWGGISPSH